MPSRPTTRETSSSGRWNSSWARNVPTNFGLESDFHVILGIFYMPQICDMGQTALLSLWRKACWGILALKIRRLRPGANPRTWVPKASTLPLDHRSRFFWTYCWKIQKYQISWKSAQWEPSCSIRIDRHGEVCGRFSWFCQRACAVGIYTNCLSLLLSLGTFAKIRFPVLCCRSEHRLCKFMYWLKGALRFSKPVANEQQALFQTLGCV